MGERGVMTGPRAMLWSAVLGTLFVVLVLWPDLAAAHDCSGPQDCEQTAGYNAVISVVGAISAIVAGVLGASFAGAATGAATTAAPPTPTGAAGPEQSTGDGGFTELSPDSGGFKVVDLDDKAHVFATWEEANRFYEHLVKQQVQDDKRETIKRLENDYRSAAEQVGFLDSVIRGLQNAGKDASEQIRERDRWIRERDQRRGEVDKVGGDTAYQTKERGDFTFGENDDLLRRTRELKESQDKLDAIHRISNTIDRLRDRNMVGADEGLTDKMSDWLDHMSHQTVSKDGKPPSWGDIEKIRNLVVKDMSATTARQDAAAADWVRDGAADTAREVFTGVNPDGETSYKAMVLRGLLGAATGGHSEIGMEVVQKTYGIHDDVIAGRSVGAAYARAFGQVLLDEGIGRLLVKGMEVGGRATGAVYDRTLRGSGVDEWARDRLRTANTILNTDVGEILRGSRREAGEGIENRLVRGGEPDLSRQGRSADQRRTDYEVGRRQGCERVDELQQALEMRRRNPGPDADARVRRAVDEVQQDKFAMRNLNQRSVGGAPNDTIHDFNHELQDSYERAHQTARERIALEYGVPVEDVKVVRATRGAGCDPVELADPRGFAARPRGGVETDPRDFVQRPPDSPIEVPANRATYDQDVTYRVRRDNVIDPRNGEVHSGHVDVHADEAKRIYNEEFYKARHDGELPHRTDPVTGEVVRDPNTGRPEIDRHAVDGYADQMDQTVNDRLSTSSYGSSDRDLKTAIDPRARGRDFSDVEQIGKVSEYKNYEWRERAEHSRAEANDLGRRADELQSRGRIDEARDLRTRADELHRRAEAQIEEGYRQTTKQRCNLLESRIDAVNRAHGRTVAEVPPRLRTAFDVMQDRRLSPVEIERRLAQIGYTPDKVAQQLSSNLEALQKFTPKPGFDYGKALTDAARAGSRSGESRIGNALFGSPRDGAGV